VAPSDGLPGSKASDRRAGRVRRNVRCASDSDRIVTRLNRQASVFRCLSAVRTDAR
jgi:hypothetical protein